MIPTAIYSQVLKIGIGVRIWIRIRVSTLYLGIAQYGVTVTVRFR